MDTSLDILQSMYSDMYKELYGIRPRNVDTTIWSNEDLLIAEINHLETVIVQDIEMQRQHEARVAAEKQALAIKTQAICNASPLRVSLFDLAGSI
jgi:hypothetical protein